MDKTTIEKLYSEAIETLHQFINEHQYVDWEPVKESTKFTSCVYLYGAKKQYAKYCHETSIKQIIEYNDPSDPNAKQLIDSAIRTDDTGIVGYPQEPSIKVAPAGLAKKGGKTGQRVRSAKTLKKLSK